MIILPAIDLLDRKVVRLYQGDYEQQQVFGDDPVVFAKEFQAKGATHLHLVDLNGAKEGTKVQFDIVRKIVAETDLFVELGGGIRTEQDIIDVLDAGVQRAILGTIAQKDPAFTQAMLKKYGEQIAVGVDARDGMVAVAGWLETTETRADDFCRQLGEWGCKTIIFTDISKDGTGKGIDVELYQQLNSLGLNIVASGGVSSLENIRELAQADTYGAIVGKALYNGTLKLEDCLQAAKEASR